MCPAFSALICDGLNFICVLITDSLTLLQVLEFQWSVSSSTAAVMSCRNVTAPYAQRSYRKCFFAFMYSYAFSVLAGLTQRLPVIFFRELLPDSSAGPQSILKVTERDCYSMHRRQWLFFSYSLFATRSAWKLLRLFNLPYKTKQTPWHESASELCRPSDRHLSAKLVLTFVNRGSVTDSYCRILGFLDRSRCFLFQTAPQLHSWGWVDPVPDSLFLRKSDSAGNRIRTSGFVARNSGH
jgi:hypothetical protein